MTPQTEQKLDTFVSIVAPVRDASAYIEKFVIETAAILESRFKDFEIIVVDNCSADDTVDVIERLQKSVRNIQLYCLVSHIDDESVFVAGLEQAIGDVVITMDPRLDPPRCLPSLLEPLARGVEIVYARQSRQNLGVGERVRRDIVQAASSSVRKRFDVSVDDSSFRLMTRKVINAFLDNSDRYALFTVIAGLTGFKHAVIEYKPENVTGNSVRRSLFGDILRSIRIMLLTSKWPLRLLIIAALIGATVNLIYSAYVVGVAVFVGGVAEGWTSLSLQIATMFFIMFMILSVLSDYVLRLIVHSQRRPHYLIARERSSLVLSRKQELNVALARREGQDSEVIVKAGTRR
ncbi:MAG: glycosyltransferase [Rhodospirillaceae bacterium]|nr:glycosyltransferase [Rhodospirillaceae bacterium]